MPAPCPSEELVVERVHFPAAGNLLEGVRSGVTFDVIRTTRQIAGSLSEFLHDRGALPEDKVLRTKRVRSSPAKTESSAPQGSAPTPA